MTTLMGVAGGTWDVMMTILIFLVVLTIVVFVHEMGHFLVARWCGVDVKVFSIGFGRELWSRVDRHGTKWQVAWIPLGGYVKFMDDENAASVPSPDQIRKMTPAQRAGSFHAKPLGHRVAVVAAGPLANFILAAVIYAALNFTIGVRTIEAVVEAVLPGQAADKAGLKPGDRIVAIDGREIDGYDDVLRAVTTTADRELRFVVERGGERVELPVTPTGQTVSDGFGGKFRKGDIGIRVHAPAIIGDLSRDMPAIAAGFKRGDRIVAIDGQRIYNFADLLQIVGVSAGRQLTVDVERGGQTLQLQVVPVEKQVKGSGGVMVKQAMIGIVSAAPPAVPVPLLPAIRLGVEETYGNIALTVRGLSDIILGRQPADQIGGPILMAQVTAKVAELGIEPWLRWLAFISANIGFLNLLPIPILDGGHLLFYAFEAVRRKPLSERMQEFGFKIGIAIILTLMIYVNLNDIVKLWRQFAGAS